MKSSILLVLFFVLGTMTCVAQQAFQDTVYLFFDTSSDETCKVEVEGKGYQNLNKFRKVDTRKQLTFFYVCDELFIFNKEEYVIDTLSTKKIPSDKIMDIDDMVKKYNSIEPKPFKHHMFDTIYIIEKLSNDMVITYKVKWNDMSLGLIH